METELNKYKKENLYLKKETKRFIDNKKQLIKGSQGSAKEIKDLRSDFEKFAQNLESIDCI